MARRHNLLHPALLVLFILIAVFFHSASLDYQEFLSQGDHGRDLYAFERTLHGERPYQDYWWNFGPLMPYYYAAFFKLFGSSIPSALIGKTFLLLASGILFFLVLAKIATPVIAFTGALWFLLFNPPFHYIYNHFGATPLILLTVYCLFQYAQHNPGSWLVIGLAACFLVSLVKLNFGIANLAAFLISIQLVHIIHPGRKKPGTTFYVASGVVFPTALLLVHAAFLYGLKSYEIQQAFPFAGGYDPHHVPVTQAFLILIRDISKNFTFNWPQRIFSVFVCLATLRTLLSIFSPGTDSQTRKNILLSISVLSVFYIVNLHEFLPSGVLYRLIWCRPFSALLLFVVIHVAVNRFPVLIRSCLLATILLLLALTFHDSHIRLQEQKASGPFLDLPKAGIHVSNPRAWVRTVEQTTHYLQQHLGKDELFLALPYDNLYYFLTGRKSPTRQLIFFDYLNIPPEQEAAIIEELEGNQTDWILLSSRMNVKKEPGLGVFGESYGPLLASHIFTHFEPVASFGDWKNAPGWAWNHGTIIYKRKTR